MNGRELGEVGLNFSPAKNWLWEASIISEVENSKKGGGGVGSGGNFDVCP